MEWWKEFFDETYYKLWSSVHPPSLCEQEAESLVEILKLADGDKVLDAPCGYGRITVALARRGLKLTGLDLSAPLLAIAKERAAESKLAHPIEFVHADLRDAKLDGDFRAALHLFSSIGYGTEGDDLRMLSTIYKSLSPGGVLYLDTMHRDALVTRRALGQGPGVRGPNGITLREKNQFDPASGKIHSTWTWNSPTLSGSKSSVMRLYSVTELVSLATRAGFASVECRVGISEEPFSEDTLGERVGLLCTKALPASV